MTSNESGSAGSPKKACLKKIATGLVISAIAAGTAWISHYWLTNRPTATRQAQPPKTTLVEAVALRRENLPVVIAALGTVVPAREVALTPSVAGEVIDVHPHLIPGGIFKANTVLVNIDDRNYALLVQDASAQLAIRRAGLEQAQHEVVRREAEEIRAESELHIEQGRHQIAEEESRLLREELAEEDKFLVLRKPQLASARANHQAARAATAAARAAMRNADAAVSIAQVTLSKAELDLERTKLRTPVDVVVAEKSVDLGSHVSPGGRLATLYGTDTYWVEILVPVDELQWIDVPRTATGRGSEVRIFHRPSWGEKHRLGRVLRIMPGLESASRMARLIVEIDDPLCLAPANAGLPPVTIGAYVRAEIHGATVENIFAIPRTALRDETKIWIMTPADTLDIREIDAIWSDGEKVYARADAVDGERLIVSDLNTPVRGMALRLIETTAPKRAEQSTKNEPTPD